MSIASSSHILASMIGPTAGGYIAAATGLRENFFVTGVLLAASLLFLRKSFVDLKGNEFPKEAAQETQPGDETPPMNAVP